MKPLNFEVTQMFEHYQGLDLSITWFSVPMER